MIELKKRPKKPEGRRTLERAEVELFPPDIKIPYTDDYGDTDYDYEKAPSPSLAEIVKYFEDKEIDISKVFPEYYDRGGDWETWYIRPMFSYTVMESQEECDARAEQYKKELKEYQDWYKENRDEVKATKAAIKEEKDRIKKEKSLAAKKKRLQNQQEKIARALEGLEQ